MPRVLTVDDSRAIRMIVSKVLVEMGLEVVEAEDGEKGLAVLKEGGIDLVVLDVTMPVLDGPGMIARMRQTSDRTPVLVLTTESKRSIVTELIKHGIEDYILKPFKNEDIRAKVERILKLPPGTGLSAGGNEGGAGATAAAAPTPSAATGATGGKPGVLVIDDMDNVHKRLRAMIPEQIPLHSAPSGAAGLKLAREQTFKLILIDREVPDMPGSQLLKQLRVLQPKVTCLAMALRTSPTVGREVKDEGYDDVLIKPFNQEALDELLGTLFDSQDLLLVRDNDVLSAAPFTGKPERLDRYYGKLIPLVKDAVREVAEGCFESVIFDASKLPPHANRLVQLVTELDTQSKKFGIAFRLVGPGSIGKTLAEYDETKEVMTFESVAKAREATA
jgi:DNA-binding response OmpR family regulator